MRTQSYQYCLTCLAILIGISLATASITQLSTSGPPGNCTKVDSCKCSYADGTVIDLSPLSRTNGTAYFSITSPTGDAFLWNPCSPFSYPKGKTTSACTNVAACKRLIYIPRPFMVSLGKQNTATFTTDKGGVHLSYSSFASVTNILLRCNRTLQNSVFEVDTYTTDVYNFILNSMYACPSSQSSNSSTSTSTSSTNPTRSTHKGSKNSAASPMIKNIHKCMLFSLALFSYISISG